VCGVTDQDNQQEPRIEPGRGAEAELTDMIRHDSARSVPLAGTISAEDTGAEGTGTWPIEQGADVLCRDGEKIGEVVEIRPGHLVVEEGFFDPHDLYIPLDLIEDHDETRLVLSISREMFETSDWTDDPDPEADGPDEGDRV
jgi:hypothetical protein